MAVLIEGTSGLIQVGPTGSPTTIGVVSEFSAELSTDVTTRGPYIGDATRRKTRTAKTSSGSLSADIPDGRDLGQTQLVLAHENATNVRLVLRAGGSSNGYTYTCPNAIISGVTFGGNAEEGYTLEFSWEDADGYTFAVSP